MALSGVAGTRGQAPSGREEAAPAGRGGAGRGYLPGPAREGTWERLSRRTKAAGEGSAPPTPYPPPTGLALNLNLYLTLCPEGGEEAHPSWDGASQFTFRLGEEASPSSSAPVESRESPARERPNCIRVEGPGVRTSPARVGVRMRPGSLAQGSRPRPCAPPWSLALFLSPASPAALAAQGRPDSLHVASAAAIQPLIER